jgi:hypothetical protein
VTKIGPCADIHRDNYKNRRPVPICTTISYVEGKVFLLFTKLFNEKFIGTGSDIKK